MRTILIVSLLFLSLPDIKVNGSREIQDVDNDSEALKSDEDGAIHLHFHSGATTDSKGEDYQFVRRPPHDYPRYPDSPTFPGVYRRHPKYGRREQLPNTPNKQNPVVLDVTLALGTLGGLLG